MFVVSMLDMLDHGQHDVVRDLRRYYQLFLRLL